MFYIAEEVVKSEQVFVDVLKLLNVVGVPSIVPKFRHCFAGPLILSLKFHVHAA